MKVTLAVRSFGPATFFCLVFVSKLASLAFSFAVPNILL